MTNSERNWLSAVPWESVVSLNKALCLAQKLEPLHNATGFSSAQRQWEASVSKKLSLRAVIEVCHETFAHAPFTFNNGNTFAAIARTLLEEPLKQISPVEAQIVRTTVCHYIVDLIGAKELQQVLRHFEAKLVAPPTDKKAEASSSPSSLAQEQRV